MTDKFSFTAIDQNIEPSGGLMDSLFSSISELLPADQTTNDYVNTVLKIMQVGSLPCTIHSVVPWEFTCAQDEN